MLSSLGFVFIIAVIAKQDMATKYLYDLCAEDRACRQMYRIESGTSQRLFEFLLRIRANNTEGDWTDVLKAHYGDDDLNKKWLHLMRSLTPHCMPCHDAINSDIGVECIGADQRLVFDSAQKRYRCAQNSTRVARSQSTETSGNEEHSSTLSVVAIVMLASVLSLSACTTIIGNLKTIRKVK
jgi:hypothetical protein